MTDAERRQKFVDDLVETVRTAAAEDSNKKEDGKTATAEEQSSPADVTDDVASYVLARVQLARAEARLKCKAKQKNGSASNSSSYFSIRSMIGLDVMSGWSLLAFLALCLMIHGYQNEYYHPVDQVTELLNQRCLVSLEDVVTEVSRAPVNCGMCRDLREMPVEHNMTRELFLSKYAYTARPVLIKNAVKDWQALKNFSLEFFRKLYDSKPESYKIQNEAGQFFPYKTEFGNIYEALHISEERQKKNWYYGWSNADPDIAMQLREYYEKPDFLPDDAESSRIDWMFMGKSAKGAQLHIDYVNRPSWQAQIKGRKIWELVPSPECMSVCHSFNVTVHPGDIINIDTNRWYHATYVYPGDFSCTIGSEYD